MKHRHQQQDTAAESYSRLQSLMQLTALINSSLDPAEVRRMAVEAVPRCVNADVASLLLIDEVTGELYFEVASGASGETLKSIRLRPGEAYLWDCATLPAFRRQGLYSALLAHVIDVLRADGLRSVWIGADLYNIASHGGIERAGFRPVADLYRGGPDGRALWLQGCPGAPAAWVADARWALFGEAH